MLNIGIIGTAHRIDAAFKKINDIYGTRVDAKVIPMTDRSHFVTGLTIQAENLHEISNTLGIKTSGSLSQIESFVKTLEDIASISIRA